MVLLFRKKMIISLILVVLIAGLPWVPSVQAFDDVYADFTATPTSGTEDLVVQFTDQSTGDPAGWSWYFGDEDFSADWTQVSANAAWSSRYGHSSVVLPDGSIVLMGGHDVSGYKNDVWRSTDGGIDWTLVTGYAAWSPRINHTSVAFPDGSIVLMGGDGGVFLNDVWRSTDGGATWVRMTANADWSIRVLHSSVVLADGSILLMGGMGTYFSLKNDVWRSTDGGATWIDLTLNAGWSVRFGQTSVVTPDGSVVLMGGLMAY